MSVLQISTPRVFLPLLKPARYKGIWGGRGSGKSHFFAELLVENCIANPGTRALCVREVQKSLKESAKRLIEDKIQALGVSRQFECLQSHINTPGGGIIAFAGMQDHTADSIKSYEGFDIAWVEEAQSMSKRSLMLLRPTMRKAASEGYPEGAEMWFSWNPLRKVDPVDDLLRGETPPPASIVVRANWNDNPFFPGALDVERSYDLHAFPERYEHVWNGGYLQITDGAYYAGALNKAKADGRITPLAIDPLMEFWTFWDIGVRDHTAIWVVQFVGTQVRCVDYYEAQGQPLASHLDWLRANGYERAICVLPHDGAQSDAFSASRFIDHITSAGFRAELVKNQGKGAALQRVEATRRMFPSIWIDPKHCEAGLDALGAYHERQDEVRGVGLGPEHNWASHGADAFGMIAIAKPMIERATQRDYEEPEDRRQWDRTGSTGY